MSSIGTFGSFTQARLAIYASQAGLSITGNNIANINTDGYTRQKVDQTSLYSGGTDRYYASGSITVGNGVICTGTSQMRDPYLDLRYRNEMASVGAMDAKLGSLEHIQRILDETGDGEEGFGLLGAQLSDVFRQLQNLNNHTGLSEYDIQVRSSAQSLAKFFNSYAARLKEVQQNAEKNYEKDIKSVNSILDSIRDLNINIRKADLHGDPALELRDERNVLIDELSSFMKIDITYGEENVGGTKVEKLMIRLGDANPDKSAPNDQARLIDGIYAAQLSVPEQVTINGETSDNDRLLIKIGKLLDTRDRPLLVDPETMTYSEEVQLTDNDLYGALHSQREFLTKSGEFSTNEDLQNDPDAATKRGLPFYQKALDLLAKQFADTFNKANQGFVRNEKGEYVTKEGTPILGTDGKAYTDASFQGLGAQDTNILIDTIKAQGGQYLGKPLFSTRGDNNETENITAENISISQAWSSGPQIVNSFVQHGNMGIASTDSSNISHMLVLMGQKMDYDAGGASTAPMFQGTFNEMWDNIGTLLGNDMMTTKTMLSTYETSSLQLNTSRDSVSTVDLNDEAMNLMQYSKSYSAACRLMTTIDTVLEKLINGTGVTR